MAGLFPLPATRLRHGLAGARGLAPVCTVPAAGFRHSRNALPLVPDAIAVVVRGNVVGGRPETGSQPAGIAETAGLGQLPNRRDSAAQAALKPWGGPAGTGAYPASWWRPRRGASYRWWLGTHQHATLAHDLDHFLDESSFHFNRRKAPQSWTALLPACAACSGERAGVVQGDRQWKIKRPATAGSHRRPTTRSSRCLNQVHIPEVRLP